MSILIKGAKMPKTCEECPVVTTCEECHYELVLEGEDFVPIYVKDSCPLVEIPPHGRLIDADFEESHYESMIIAPTPDVTERDKLYASRIVTALRMAKTVIEREAEE